MSSKDRGNQNHLHYTHESSSDTEDYRDDDHRRRVFKNRLR